MHLAWAAGLSLIYINPALMQGKWLHIKLTVVILLSVFTIYGGRLVKRFASKNVTMRSRTFRFLNEVPTLLMIIIVSLVVFKPF